MSERVACFTEGEWEAWADAAVQVNRHTRRVPSPCWDCLPLYAIAQRIAGKCDGHPFGVEDGDEMSTPAHLVASSRRRTEKKRQKMARAVELYATGITQRQVAEAMGLNVNTVYWYLREAKYDAP